MPLSLKSHRLGPGHLHLSDRAHIASKNTEPQPERIRRFAGFDSCAQTQRRVGSLDQDRRKFWSQGIAAAEVRTKWPVHRQMLQGWGRNLEPDPGQGRHSAVVVGMVQDKPTL